jgi:hypothetical protein
VLGGHAAGDVDVVAAGGRADHGQRQHPEDRQADVDALLGAGDRVPGQRAGGHELEQALAEQLALGEGDPVPDHPGGQAQGDVAGLLSATGTSAMVVAAIRSMVVKLPVRLQSPQAMELASM